MIKKRKGILKVLLFVSCCIFLSYILSSCSAPKPIYDRFAYFEKGADTIVSMDKERLMQPKDIISIFVYSRTPNQEQAAIFNLPSNNQVTTNPSSTTSNSSINGYTINEAGEIEMPVIGAIKVAGLSKDHVQKLLESKLSDYVKNPLVIVNYLSFKVDILGEVKMPSVQNFATDKVTIIDALSAAGDLTDYGKRENVTVIRQEEGKKVYHRVDLTSKTIFTSPVYNLKPNDIVYVSPNENKARAFSRQLNPPRNNTSIIFSIIAAAVSIATVYRLFTF